MGKGLHKYLYNTFVYCTYDQLRALLDVLFSKELQRRETIESISLEDMPNMIDALFSPDEVVEMYNLIATRLGDADIIDIIFQCDIGASSDFNVRYCGKIGSHEITYDEMREYIIRHGTKEDENDILMLDMALESNYLCGHKVRVFRRDVVEKKEKPSKSAHSDHEDVIHNEETPVQDEVRKERESPPTLNREESQSQCVEERKGNNFMKSIESMFPNMKFGEVSDENIKMSHMGVAVKNTGGTYVSYDPVAKNIVDVDMMAIDGDNMLFYWPVQFTDIKVGDTILNNGQIYYITQTRPVIKGISLEGGFESNIMFTFSMFGLNFVTKIMSMMDFMSISGGGTTPANNMMMALMFALSGKDDGALPFNGDNEDDKLIMILMMFAMSTSISNGQNDPTNIFSNPFMMYMMMRKGKSAEGAMFAMFMMQAMQQQAAATHAPNFEQARIPEDTSVTTYSNNAGDTENQE